MVKLYFENFMKNVFIFLSFLSMALNAVPRISCSAPVYEFGTLDESATLHHTFVIKNEGDEDLNLGKVRACCGAKVKVAKKVLKPGEKLDIPFEMKLKGRKGTQDKNIFIASDDPKTPYLNLKIKGSVKRYYQITDRYIRLDNISTDSVINEKVVITQEKDFPFEITKVETNNKAFSASFKKLNIPLSSLKKYKVSISGKGSFKPGRLSNRVKIFTDNDAFPYITVYLSGVVKSPLSVLPKSITVTKSAKAVKRFLAIRSKHKDFEISLQDIPAGVEFIKKKRKLGEWICTLTIDSAKLTENSELVLSSTFPGVEEIKVPITVKEPRCRVSLHSLTLKREER